MDSSDFSNKKVLVTGASRGIGLGIARGFARARADLFIIGTNDKVHETANSLTEESGNPVEGLVCDITDRHAVSKTVSQLGQIDVLINNAGYERLTPILESGSEVENIFRRIIDVNILGTYYVTREAVSRMVSGSRIVITASVWGKTGMAGFTAYCASKHANIGFMRALADELGPRGITVNAVCPGWVRTDAAMRSLSIMASNESRSEEDCLNDILSAQAIEGLMEPDDVASTYLFLASDQACNITGQALSVDRGELLT